MPAGKKLSAPIRLILELVLTIVVVYLLSTYLERIFFVYGGLKAYIIIGSLLTLMNVIVRPILHVIFLPFTLFMGIIATIVIQALFLFVTEKIASSLDPTIVALHIGPWFGGWLLASIILGLTHWVIKTSLR